MSYRAVPVSSARDGRPRPAERPSGVSFNPGAITLARTPRRELRMRRVFRVRRDRLSRNRSPERSLLPPKSVKHCIDNIIFLPLRFQRAVVRYKSSRGSASQKQLTPTVRVMVIAKYKAFKVSQFYSEGLFCVLKGYSTLERYSDVLRT